MSLRLNLLFAILVLLAIPIGFSQEAPTIFEEITPTEIFDMFDIYNPVFYVMNVSPTQVTPGETSTLNVTLKHLGTRFASRIAVSLDPRDVSPIDPLGAGRFQIDKSEEAQKTAFFGVVEQLDEINLSFDFNVDPNVEEKTYFVPLVLTWGERYIQILQLGIQVEERDADFQVMQSSPEVLISGETYSLLINIKNFGENYALDLKADIDLNDVSPIDSIGRTRLVFVDQKILPGEDIVLEYPVNVKQNTPEKVYYVPIALEWEDDTSVSKNQTIMVGYLIKEPHSSIEVSYEAPDKITPGEEFNLGLTIENKGDTIYHIDTIVGGDRESLLSKSPDNIHIEELATGESELIQMTFVSNKDLATGLYSIPITLKYEGLDGQPKAQTEFVPVEVNGLAKLNIASLKIEPQNPRKGEEITIEARIENVGDDDAENTKLVLDSELEGFKTAYLGELEKDDDSPAIFTLRAATAGEVINTLILTYEDDFGEHDLTEEIIFNISENNNQNIQMLSIGLLVAFVFVIRFAVKKRKG
jgi:hypothetical protein